MNSSAQVQASQTHSRAIIWIEKTALQHHLQSAYPQMMLRLEACDHPTDPEIIALGRKHFRLD